MRRRAFKPEALGELEDRVVPSGPPRGPVVLSGLHFNTALDLVKRDFELYAMSGDFERLRAMLSQHTSGLPFHRVDAIGRTINAILAQMQSDLAAEVPRAIAMAHGKVADSIRADVQARIDNGTIVVGP
jgi:hypothetical protein